MIRRGQGSLVCSLYGSDANALADIAMELADSHGRVHVISPDVAALQTGHGNVMPQSLHGGPDVRVVVKSWVEFVPTELTIAWRGTNCFNDTKPQ